VVALDTVLSTRELLELILSQLPLRDLLIAAPRVCKLWNAMILTPALQRLLFFQPDPNSTARRNALLTAAFPPFFAPEDADGDYPSGPASILAMPWASAPEAFRRKSASWRRMLVVQPPARTLLMTNTHHTPGGTYQRHGRVSLNPGDGGLRMGLLYDL
ncbi:hypothetical protein C8R46DRAFT_870291, partial [Mycena filopes]